MGMSFAVAVSIVYMASLHFYPSSTLIIEVMKSIELQGDCLVIRHLQSFSEWHVW